VRIAVTGQTFWRLVIVAEEGSRASLIEEYASPAADTAAYSNAVTELFVEQGAKLEYVSLQNLSTETWHFATHHARVGRDGELDWVAGGFGSKKGKTRIQNDLSGSGATSRVTGATTRSRSTSPRTASPTSRSRARSATTRRRCGAG
jgi:Fe-S cluster assembly protein SufD